MHYTNARMKTKIETDSSKGFLLLYYVSYNGASHYTLSVQVKKDNTIFGT